MGSIASHPRRWEAYALIGAGLGGALVTLLSFHGFKRTAAAIGIYGGIAAATYGAVRILSTPPS